MQPPKPLYSYLAAAALALVTIFTFFVYQDFGPQSAIRRFHMDVVRNDLPELSALSVQPVNSSPTRQLRSVVMDLVNHNATYEIVSLKRFHGEVLAGVEYRFPNGFIRTLVWHVQQNATDWKIDCGATVAEMYPQFRLQ